MSYQLKPDQIFKGHKELHENGIPKFCPFQAPVSIRTSQLSQDTVPLYKSCGTWCALFSITESTDNKWRETIKTAKLKCSLNVFEYQIEEEKSPLSTIA